MVPYNPFLLLKYDCHINVEICSTIRAVKYLYKYVYKGVDRTMIGFKRVDKKKKYRSNEIKEFIDCRYISAIEAAYRLFEFTMHSRFPSVRQLYIHLPEKHTVTYNRKACEQKLEKAIKKQSKTTLTQWMKNNDDEIHKPLPLKKLGRNAKGEYNPRGPDLKYFEYPKYYRWKDNKWVRRTRKDMYAIGRMHTVSPREGERYYLRILLNHIKGAARWDDLYGDCLTFKDHCMELGILEDDAEWDEALNEAKQCQMPKAMRRLFAMIIKECAPQEPDKLWLKYKYDMSEDYIIDYQKYRNRRYVRKVPAEIVNRCEKAALYEICGILESYNIDPKRHKLEKPRKTECYRKTVTELELEQSYNPEECKKDWSQRYNNMNEQQKQVYHQVIAAVENNNGNGVANNVFFLDAKGGTVCIYCLYVFLIDSLISNLNIES